MASAMVQENPLYTKKLSDRKLPAGIFDFFLSLFGTSVRVHCLDDPVDDPLRRDDLGRLLSLDVFG